MIKKSINDLFCQYIKPLLKDSDHLTLIQEWKQFFYADVYENKVKLRRKASIREERN